MVTSHDTGITHAVISEKFYEFQVEYNPVCIDWFSMCTMETQSISGDAEGGANLGGVEILEDDANHLRT